MAKANKASKVKKTTKATSTVNFLSLPAPVVKNVPLSALSFDRRLQHRSKLTDEATVKEYATRDEDAAKKGDPTPLPPARAIFEKGKTAGQHAPGTPDRYWVYNGFQRGAAWEANGREEVPVEVTPGTFADAYFLSLSANSDESVLPRSYDDARRAVVALVEDESAMQAVRAALKKAGKGAGGLNDFIAKACGVSSGTAHNALVDLGLQCKGDQIVKRPKRTETPEPPKPDSTLAPVPALKAEPTEPPAPPTAADEKAKQAANDKAYADLRALAFSDRVAECARLTKRIGNIMSTMMIDDKRGPLTRELMSEMGLGVSEDFDVRQRAQGKEFRAYYEILELWPATAKLGAFFLALRQAHDRATDAENAPPVPVEVAGAEPTEPDGAAVAPSVNGSTKPKKGAAAEALAELKEEGAAKDAGKNGKDKKKGKGTRAAKEPAAT